MIKEQIFTIAMKTLGKAQQAKETLEKKIDVRVLKSYVSLIKSELRSKADKILKTTSVKAKRAQAKTTPKKKQTNIKVPKSVKAESILENLPHSSFRMIKEEDTLLGTKMLAYVVWSLGQASDAKIDDGLAISDVTSLLQKAKNIKVHSINVSKAIHSGAELIASASTPAKRKVFKLTSKGQETFKECFAK